MLKFWNPESGAVGGVIMGSILGFAILAAGGFLFPPLFAALLWWSSMFGF